MPNLQPHDQVGDYILQDALDEGGQGYIWRARHAQTGALVAIKLLTKPSSSGETGQLRQDIELMAAAAANHSPNIVHVLGGSLEPVPHIIMEYIDGTDLRKELIRLRELHGSGSDGVAQDEVIRVGIAVAGALKLLHAEGIIHRDVKPANVMMDRRGNIKLTDFGIAKIIGYHSVSIYGDHPLSLAYAAPEVWAGEPVPASDVYALGATLFELLTGHPPFEGFAASLYTKHTSEKPNLDVLPPGTVASLRVLLDRCLEKEIAARPRAETCLALLNAAQAEINEALASPIKHEPRRFGDWTIVSPIDGQPWAWRCIHRESRVQAILEVQFVPSLVDLGEALRHARQAIEINPRLAIHGAERLYAADRVMLGPDEAWPGITPGPFAYFIAREDSELPAQPTFVSRAGLKAIATSLASMERIAAREDVSLNFDASELSLLNQNSVRLSHPGLSAPSTLAGEAALAFLRSLPLDESTQASVLAAQSLSELVDLLGEQEAAQPDALGGTLVLDPQALQETRQALASELHPPPASDTTGQTIALQHEAPSTPVAEPAIEANISMDQVTIGPRPGVAPPADSLTGGNAAPEASPPVVIPTLAATGSAHPAPESVPVVAMPPAPAPGGFSLSIISKRSSTRFGAAQFSLNLTSLSNRPQTISLQAQAPGDAVLSLPSSVTLPPLAQSVVVVSAAPRNQRWWGKRRTRSFMIAAGGGDDGGPPRSVEGSFHDDSKNWLPLSGGLGAVVLAVLAFAFMAGGGGKHNEAGPPPANAAVLVSKATVEVPPTTTPTAVPTPVPPVVDEPVADPAAPPLEPPPPGATATRVPPTATPRPAAAPGASAPAAQAPAPAPAAQAPAPAAQAPAPAPTASTGGISYSMIGFATTKVGAGTAPPDVVPSGGSLRACSSTYFYMFFTVRNATAAISLSFDYSVEGNRIGTYSFNTETGSHNYWFGFPINQPRNGQGYRVTTTTGGSMVLDGRFTLAC